MLVWTGTDLDIRDYKNYWKKENEEQNWPNKVWYDNPYFIANEIVHSSDYDIVNGFLTASYEFTPWLKASLRSGVDTYSERENGETLLVLTEDGIKRILRRKKKWRI